MNKYSMTLSNGREFKHYVVFEGNTEDEAIKSAERANNGYDVIQIQRRRY